MPLAGIAGTVEGLHRRAERKGNGRRGCWRGGERGIDIARQLAYKDGSAIPHLLTRLDSEVPGKRALAQGISALDREFKCIPSSVNGLTSFPRSSTYKLF